MAKKITRHFENAFETAYKARHGEHADLTEAAIACITVASEIDRLGRSLIENAERLAMLSTRFATEIASGYLHAQAPTASSIISDITREKQAYESKIEELKALCRVVYGLDFVKAMFDAAKATFEAARAEQVKS